MSAPFVWTPERVGHLCRRYAEGAIHSQIGAELGCGKNACIGKFNRLLKQQRSIAVWAADTRAGSGTMDAVSAWMAAYGGSIATCARSLGLNYDAARAAWNRIRDRLGDQAK